MDVDYLRFDDNQKEQIEKLAALGYTVEQIAMYLDVDVNKFKHDAETEGCIAFYCIKRGKLIVKAESDMKILESIAKGSVTAIQQMEKIRQNQLYFEILDQMDDAET